MRLLVRRLTAALIITAMILAGFPSTSALAQIKLASMDAGTPTDPTSMIASTVKAFPNGGEPLKQAIADLISKYPHLAANLASYLKNDTSLTPGQKQAIVVGLADALNRLGVVAQAAGGLCAIAGQPVCVDPVLLALLVVAGIVVPLALNNGAHTVSPN